MCMTDVYNKDNDCVERKCLIGINMCCVYELVNLNKNACSCSTTSELVLYYVCLIKLYK